jgi:hypothetical protein
MGSVPMIDGRPAKCGDTATSAAVLAYLDEQSDEVSFKWKSIFPKNEG